jgi:hypothetical protein
MLENLVGKSTTKRKEDKKKNKKKKKKMKKKKKKKKKDKHKKRKRVGSSSDSDSGSDSSTSGGAGPMAGPPSPFRGHAVVGTAIAAMATGARSGHSATRDANDRLLGMS